MKVNSPSLMHFLFLFFATVFLIRCGDGGPDGEINQPPILLVYGEDLSGSVGTIVRTNLNDLAAICKAVSETGSGGIVVFMRIADSTENGYEVCLIDSLVKPNDGYTLADELEIKQKNDVIKGKNEQEITTFLSKCDELIRKRDWQNTDINNFFRHSSIFFNEPGKENYIKWLFVNSDGKQDTGTSKELDCTLIRGADVLSVSKSWKSNQNCAAQFSQFADPNSFTQYFKSQIQPKK